MRSLWAWAMLVMSMVRPGVHAEANPPPDYQVLLRGTAVATFAVAEGLQVEATAGALGPVRLAQGRVRREFVSWLQQLRADLRVGTEEIIIREVDTSGRVLRSWRLVRVGVQSWTGPTLNARPGGDVAMDEVVLSAEGVTPEDGV